MCGRARPVHRRRTEGTHGRNSPMDLTTEYMDMELRNPLVASASPLSNTIAGIRQLADSGVGAIVLYSLFEEQLRHDAEQGAAYLSLLERAVAAVDIPVIASLNGAS